MKQETPLKAQIIWEPAFDKSMDQRIDERVQQIVEQKIVELREPLVYNLSEACHAAHCSYNTLYKWIQDGLPEISYGRYKRIRKTDLEAWLEKLAV